jgi:hypothetical protein
MGLCIEAWIAPQTMFEVLHNITQLHYLVFSFILISPEEEADFRTPPPQHTPVLPIPNPKNI